METILSFFSDLILFTAGLVVVTIWIAILFAIVIETIDLINELLKPKKEN
jgi:hypothetical protein